MSTDPSPGTADTTRAEREHDAEHLLRLYLRDHWALAGAGAAQADRLCRANQDSPWAHQLERIRRELRADDATLERVRRSVGSDKGRVQRTVALAGERLGRLKLNGRLLTYSPLSRVLETEILMAGILAKQQLWTTLATVVGPERAGADFAQLIERAGAQLTTMQAFHDWAITEAFEPPLEMDHQPDRQAPAAHPVAPSGSRPTNRSAPPTGSVPPTGTVLTTEVR